MSKSASSLKKSIEGKFSPRIQAHTKNDIIKYKSTSISRVSTTKGNSESQFAEIPPSLQSPSRVGKRAIPLPPTPSTQPREKPSHLENSTESHLVQALKDLLEREETLHPPQLEFKTDMATAQRNFAKLQQANFELEQLLQGDGKNVLSYGSEFKEVSSLEKLLHLHPRWLALQHRLLHGASFPITTLSDEERRNDLEGRMERGNHKSAAKHPEFLSNALKKEVEKGWMLPLPMSTAKLIPNLEMAPMGVAVHMGISADGTYIPKERVTHDLSFPGSATGSSINSRLLSDEMEPCMFGHMFLRLLHYIIHLRQHYPTKKIWLRKEDFKSAYRRLHVNAVSAWKSVVQMNIEGNELLLVSLRLPFGGASCPPDFCLASDIITDTINDLLEDPTWDHTKVKSEYTSNIPIEMSLADHIEFEPALEMSVDLPPSTAGKADVYIDDVISCTVDVNNNLQKLKAAACTVIHAMAHKAKGPTHLTRQEFIADDKNEAEGAPEEVKVCLGWCINTRSLTVSLPQHKFTAWDADIANIITRKSTNNLHLEKILGRLEHVAAVVKPMGHFLNNIRSLQIKAEKRKHNIIIPASVKDDFHLTRKFLKKAKEGININILVFRSPTITFIGDASEYGMGGFDTGGRGWRYLIPAHLRGRAHINLLEFITQVVGIWLALEEKRLKPLGCILAMGDSTTAQGWLRRSNFRAKGEDTTDWKAKQKVARKLGHLILDSNTLLYQQWFMGKENVVADSLSRDLYYLSLQSHQSFLHSSAPSQIPNNFHLRPLPAKICCFITSVLLPMPVQEQRLTPPRPSDLARGNIGTLSSMALALKHPPILTDAMNFRKTSSSQPLPKQSEKVLSLNDITSTWWKEQSTPPSHMWLRPSGQTTGKTPDWTQTEKCVSS